MEWTVIDGFIVNETTTEQDTLGSVVVNQTTAAGAGVSVFVTGVEG